MIEFALALFVLSGCVSTARLLLGPGLADRIVALDVTLICFMGAIAAHAALIEQTTYLMVLVVLAIIGFTATVAAARFLQHERTLPALRRQPSEGTADGVVGAVDGATEEASS